MDFGSKHEDARRDVAEHFCNVVGLTSSQLGTLRSVFEQSILDAYYNPVRVQKKRAPVDERAKISNEASYQEIADHFGVGKSTVVNWIDNETLPRVDLFSRLAAEGNVKYPRGYDIVADAYVTCFEKLLMMVNRHDEISRLNSEHILLLCLATRSQLYWTWRVTTVWEAWRQSHHEIKRQLRGEDFARRLTIRVRKAKQIVEEYADVWCAVEIGVGYDWL